MSHNEKLANGNEKLVNGGANGDAARASTATTMAMFAMPANSGAATPDDPVKRKEGWRARRRAHRQARKASHQARALEAELPEIFRVKSDDVDGHKHLKRASLLLTVKNEVVAALSEFIGTFLFLFLSFGIASAASQQSISASGTGQTRAGSGLDPSSLMLSSLGFGFSLAVNAFAFFRVSGGLFNPAVTLALYLTQSLTGLRALIFVPVQIGGALSAAGLAQVLYPGGISVRTRLSATTSVGRGFVIEMLMTAQLVMAIFMLAGEKHKGTFIAPVGIGLALFICELWSTSLTGGSLNPARSLGPDVVARAFDGSAWIYYAGPFTGALLSTAIYKFLKWARYETANSGQDDDGIHLLMRDAQGRAQGFVDQVPSGAPELAEMRQHTNLSRVPTPDTIGTSSGIPSAGLSNGAAGRGLVSPTPVRARDHDLEAQVDTADEAEGRPGAAA